jgi:hypothetical protein
MSISGTPTSYTLTPTQRTRSVLITTPFGQTYSMAIYRETLALDGNGDMVGQSQPYQPFYLNFPDIQAQSVTAGGVTATVAQIAALIQAFCDTQSQAVTLNPV